jgi:HlyD family secretion protein
VLTNQVAGTNCYQAKIVPKLDEIEKLSSLELAPRMPVEAFWESNERRTFTSLVKPITGYYNKAFHED